MTYKKILRWIAVIPSAVGGLFVGPIGINLLAQLQSWLIGGNADGGYVKITFWVISSAIGGALAVYWASKVAPSHHKIVSAVIAGLVLLVATIGFLFSSEDNFVWPLLGSLAMIFGSGYQMHKVYEDEENFNFF